MDSKGSLNVLQIIVRVHTEECFLMRDKDKNYNELSSEIMQTVKIMEVLIMLGKNILNLEFCIRQTFL